MPPQAPLGPEPERRQGSPGTLGGECGALGRQTEPALVAGAARHRPGHHDDVADSETTDLAAHLDTWPMPSWPMPKGPWNGTSPVMEATTGSIRPTLIAACIGRETLRCRATVSPSHLGGRHIDRRRARTQPRTPRIGRPPLPGRTNRPLSDALRSAGDAIATRLRQAAGSGASPVQVYSAIVQHYRSALADSAFRSGCPVWAAAQEAYADPALGQVVTEILDEWTTLLSQVLVRAGHEPVASRRVALLCISALEGAITMSRVQRSVEPIDLTHTMMLPLLADPPT
jgi:Transcriptional regulator LmrA/YxaF-like, C-terminal domain